MPSKTFFSGLLVPWPKAAPTADPTKADKRTRSKWSRLMRYAVERKLSSEPLDRFVQRKGGINACAARFSRPNLPRSKRPPPSNRTDFESVP